MADPRFPTPGRYAVVSPSDRWVPVIYRVRCFSYSGVRVHETPGVLPFSMLCWLDSASGCRNFVAQHTAFLNARGLAAHG